MQTLINTQFEITIVESARNTLGEIRDRHRGIAAIVDKESTATAIADYLASDLDRIRAGRSVHPSPNHIGWRIEIRKRETLDQTTTIEVG